MDCTVLENTWISPCFRLTVLDTLLPICVLLLWHVPLVFARIFPDHGQKSTPGSSFFSLFRSFLTLDDLQGVAYERAAKPSHLKARVSVLLACAEAVGWVAFGAYEVVQGVRWGVAAGVIQLILWAYVIFRMSTKPPRSPPYGLLLFYTLGWSSAFVNIVAHIRDPHNPRLSPSILLPLAHIIIESVLIWIVGTLLLQPVPPAANIAGPEDKPSIDLSNPEDGVTLWEWCTFSFIEPIFGVATKRRVEETDVWELSPFFRHKALFEKYLQYHAHQPTHSLLRFLIVSNSMDLIIDIATETWSAVIGFIPPYCLQNILSSLNDPNPASRAAAHNFAFLTLLAHLTFAQLQLFRGWHTRRCYERTRGILFCALHWKALKRKDISGKVAIGEGEEEGAGSADLGKVVNLMQGDAYAVAQRFWEFSGFFLAPVRLVIALVFLFQVLGWSSLAGVVVVLVAYVLNYPLARYNIFITKASWKSKDTRMNGVNELFQNIRFLKFYGWENFWAGKVRKYRETELSWRVKENIVATLISFIWTWIPSATALFSFMFYTLVAKQELTVAKAFTAIALFSQLQEPMTALPNQVFALLHAYVSMNRIQSFLGEDEVPEWATSLSAQAPENPVEDIGFEHATFEWNASSSSSSTSRAAERFQLGPLNVSLPKGKLTLISGATGSGKTAFLTALLGEMDCLEGRVTIDKRLHQVAYCAQNPWLEHATIRDNIIFGSAHGYDEARYDAVIDACALGRDLEVLDAGDMTEIGEKGVTLSGGQRARVALARALYSEARVILLDDPLAAVDMHTAKHIADYCLSGELAEDRTIILVTHHIKTCLPIASYVVQLSSGKIVRSGTPEDFAEVDPEILGDEEEAEEALDEKVASAPETVDDVEENEADLAPTHEKSKWRKAQTSDGKLVEVEARAEGRVSLRTYLTYIRAAGLFSWMFTFLLMILIRLITIGTQVFLARWGEAYDTGHPSLLRFMTVTFHTSSAPAWYLDNLPPPAEDVKPWLLIYLYLSLAGAFAVLAYIALGYYASLQASRSLFLSMLARLIRAPSRWFDVTPAGRILNRFTSDINTLDNALQNSSRAALSGILNFLASFCVIIFVVPGFAPFALFIAWLYVRLAPPYVQASRDLRRLESISLSPAFAAFDELLRGLAHVRAFAMEGRYQQAFYSRIDRFQNYDHVYWLVSGWLRWRYDCLGSLVVYAATIAALWSGVSNGSAALVIVQAGVFAEASRQLVRVLAQLELDFNSVERIVEYLSVPQEAPSKIPGHEIPAYWPSDSGGLVVQNLLVRYAPELPPALNRISFSVNPGEKIGVVGRTGSGKSTLALSLLRMIEASEGSIVIDGLDISTLGLEDLRTRVTIISQDVSLFSGTIRSNLDPFGEHSDEEMWEVLERCHLADRLGTSKRNSVPLTLDTPISQSGSLSAGERQLLALARAVLRRTNIVIMDEATSQIDLAIDDQIQRTIREELSSALVITIAHRLKTVIDYDRILVLGHGEILEFDTPAQLLATLGGAFREMCRRSADWRDLRTSVTSVSTPP